jgi:hypothetical protein
VPATIGIPPQITHLHKINTIEECCKDIKTAVLDFKAELRDAVSQATDAKVDESWSINALMLDSSIEYIILTRWGLFLHLNHRLIYIILVHLLHQLL